MDLWCGLCMSRNARLMARTVTRGWALCEGHATFDLRLHRPDLDDEAFTALLCKAADEADC